MFYEARRRGLGATFTREIERILAAPEQFRALEQDVRRCLAHVFPYGVLYTVERDFILIIAVAHASAGLVIGRLDCPLAHQTPNPMKSINR